MGAVQTVRDELSADWLPNIYEQKVRSGRTRACKIEVPRRENRALIQHTLLGIELKVGRRRFSCPDLATARYMRVFARIGCREFAVPYDITRVPAIADELETAWQRALLILENLETSASARASLIKEIRAEIERIGPGDLMPLFDRETKQRRGE
jgi:hypothetical protein